MPESEDFANLATEFRGLSAAQQREIRGSLTTFERIQFDALLNAPDDLTIIREDCEAPGIFSSWLGQHIRSAEADGHGPGRSAITPLARAALLELAQAASTDATGSAPKLSERPRSLLGAFGGLLSGEQRS